MRAQIAAKEGYFNRITGPASAQWSPSTGNVYIVAATTVSGYKYLESKYNMWYDNDGTKMLYNDVDSAINACTASRGDTIYVLEGHTETLSTAADWALDTIGVSIIGCGTGSMRPKISIDTEHTEAAPILISATGCRISNMWFYGSNAGGSKDAIEITASNTIIDNCLFTEASTDKELGIGAAYGVITIIDTAAAVDDVQIRNCVMRGLAGNDESFISVTDGTNGATNVVIDGCHIIGTFADDTIQADAGTNVNTEWVITNSIIGNVGGNHIAATIDTGAVFYMHNVLFLGDSGTTVPLVGHNASYQGALYSCEAGSSNVAIGSATNWGA